MKRLKVFAGILLFAFAINSCKNQQSASSFDPIEFQNPSSDFKVHTWWHWLDGAISKEGITKDLESMKKQGIGQATILNVGLFNGKDFGVKPVLFDSPEWHEMFKWALQEANRLGISIGAHNCDGWSTSGGPWITPDMSMKQFVWTKTYVSAGNDGALKLQQPYTERDFYKDVAVLAYKTNRKTNSFHRANPLCTVNESFKTGFLFDGDPSSAIKVVKGDKIQISFEKEFKAEKLVIHPRKKFMWGDMSTFKTVYAISVSNDGKSFRKIKEIEITELNKSSEIEIPVTNSKFYQIELLDLSNIDSYIDLTISEIELLQNDENPLFSTTVEHLLEKAVAIKASEKSFFENSKAEIKYPIQKEEIINLTGKMTADGNLDWKAPDGDWCVLRFGYTTTGALNGPATKEGTGLECDKMDTSALNLHFSNFPKRLINDAGALAGNTFKFILIDSWECGYQNWTAGLPEEFLKSRGYDLLNWIPVLCGETVVDANSSDAFLYDFRKTIADMVENNYYKHFRDLCHKENIELHAEIIYGDANYPPLEILRSNTYADLPMFEFWSGHNQNTFTEYTPSKPFESFPVFAANAYNMPVVGSEAYTAMSHYSESPNDLKLFGDRAFCSGINQMILHSYVHQPLDKKPGMTLGQFSSHFNRNNSYWNFASEWMKYQQRIQYILQKGIIASDILFYVGDELPQYLDNKIVNSLPFGFRGMACNYDLLKNAFVKNGKIILGNGLEYKLLILPESDAMELATLTIISQLVEQGAIILGKMPANQLSMSGLTNDKAAFEELSLKLWGENGDSKTIDKEYGKGRVFSGFEASEVLAKCKISPEFSTGSNDVQNLIYIHKKQGDADIYFVANQTENLLNRECVFSVTEKTPFIWNPLNGDVTRPAVFSDEDNSIRIPVTFKPRESMIFIFENGKPSEFINEVFEGDKQIFPALANENAGTVPSVNVVNSEFLYSSQTSGSYTFITSKDVKISKELVQDEVFEISDFDCDIQFQPSYDADIQSINTKELKSLTEYEEPAVRYFSGIARYTIKFSMPENFVQTDDVFLNLGIFESIASVSLNAKPIGIVWMKNSELKINDMLQKENTIEIEVANVSRNRIIGDYIEFGQLKNVWTSAPVEQFLDKDKPLKPSGLIGPIRIVKKNNIK